MTILRMALLSLALALGTSFAPVASAQQPGAHKSLYDRLGGLKGITVVVDDFINRLVANNELNKNPAIVMAKEFKKSLDKFKVPAAEQKELFDIVGTTKADIVVRK